MKIMPPIYLLETIISVKMKFTYMLADHLIPGPIFL